MNYNRFLFSLVLSAIVFALPIQAVFESFTMWVVDTPRGPVEVIVLGEYHYCYTKDQRDFSHTEDFKRTIQNWANGHRKTIVLLEQDEGKYTSEKIQKEMDALHAIVLNPKLSAHAQHQGMLFEIADFLKEMQSDKVAYSWCDNRKHVGNFYLLFSEMREGKAHACGTCNPETVGDYFKELEDCLAMVREYKNTLPEMSINYAVLAQYERDLLINKVRAQLALYTLAKAHPTTPYVHPMHQLHMQNERVKLDKDHPLYFCNHLLDVAADAGFLVEFMKQVQQYDRVVFAAGSVHSFAINNYLLRLAAAGMAQCKGVYGRNIQNPVKSGHIVLNPIDVTAMKNLFVVACSEHCNYCSKLTDSHKPLMRCGSCQLAKYCSKDCQRQDWKDKHKELCGRLIKGRDEAKKIQFI